MVTGTIRANDPDQYKSVYSNALQYAFDRNIPTAKLRDFMEINGGYKGCDKLHRKKNSTRKKSVAAKKHK